jgi:predicted amidohydrolase
MLKIASAVYNIELLANWQAYEAKINLWVNNAVQQGATLLLFPEYAGIEIACAQFANDKALFQALQTMLPCYRNFYQQLAQTHQIYIQPGTIIEAIGPEQYVNRAYFFTPSGEILHQDKLHLTEYEKKLTVLVPGTQQQCIDTRWGKIGIAICYDSEFPEVVSTYAQQNAKLILVPSYTTSMAGFNRVYISSRARAIENQCYVAVAFVAGEVNLSGETDMTYGCAAMLTPADKGFPDDGILSQSELNHFGWTFAELDTAKIDQVRTTGDVHNYLDRFLRDT